MEHILHIGKFSVLTLQCTKLGENYGRKMMHGVMKTKGINVSETKIGTILDDINPEVQTKRQNVANRSLNPKLYNATYFGDKFHYDQNEKMGMFGVVHVFARDGIFGNIVAHATMTRKTKLVLHEEIYKLMIIFFI